MPSRKGSWRAATIRAWAGWAESGRMSLLDEAGMDALSRLMKLIDKADANDWPVGLAREVRLQEAALMRAANASPASVETAPTKPERKAQTRKARDRHIAKRQAELDRLGLTEDELAADELAALA